MNQRKYIDCRDMPSEMNCTLKISGTEEEVVKAAAEHAVSVHGHENTPELEKMIRAQLKDDVTDKPPFKNVPLYDDQPRGWAGM